jgi:predicted regulator of Ras-like GTPase activity (Roadblock/LC7/MglB family)
MATASLSPAQAPAALCELSREIRAAVLADPAGAPLGVSGVEAEHARSLGAAAAELFGAVDRACPERPVEQVEVQVEGAGIYALRDAHFTLAAVASRTALPSLALLDLRHVLARVRA